MKISGHPSGQVAVGYILTIAALSLGVAAALYGPQIQKSFSLLYTDASTRVIESGPVGAGDVKKAQVAVWGSADLPPMPAPPVAAPPPPPAPPPASVPWAGGTSPGTPPSPAPPPAVATAKPPPAGSPSSSGGSTGSMPPVPPVPMGGLPSSGGSSGAGSGGFSSSSNMSSALSDGTEGGTCTADASGGSPF